MRTFEVLFGVTLMVKLMGSRIFGRFIVSGSRRIHGPTPEKNINIYFEFMKRAVKLYCGVSYLSAFFRTIRAF
jgi:hypothetical protein